MASQMWSPSGQQPGWCFRNTKTHSSSRKKTLPKRRLGLYKQLQNSSRKPHEVYPSGDDLELQEAGIKYLPDTLKVLLEGLFSEKKAGVNVASIGQAITQATRPRVLMAPLQFGLGDAPCLKNLTAMRMKIQTC